MHQINNPRSVPPFHAAVPLDHGMAPASALGLAWRIYHRQGVADRVGGFASPDAATEAACRLLDSGSDVVGIGTAPDEVSIGRERLALIYARWVRARYN